jgi:hypothetical protein
MNNYKVTGGFDITISTEEQSAALERRIALVTLWLFRISDWKSSKLVPF